jgi:hypothetical protein
MTACGFRNADTPCVENMAAPAERLLSPCASFSERLLAHSFRRRLRGEGVGEADAAIEGDEVV